MIIDFHMHERTFSNDSHMNLIEMVVEAKKKGLDGICITDHDEYGLVEYAKKISEQMNFQIFVGTEYLTLEGDIVAFGFGEMPAQRHMAAQDFVDYVNSKGGVCISAHPYRSNSRGLEDKLYEIKGLCGIEVLNGSASDSANKKAYETCKKLGLQMIGASDCHNLIALGRYATYVPYDCKTVEDLVYALKTVKCEAVILSGYKKFDFN